jgi:hypothetical protein
MSHAPVVYWSDEDNCYIGLCPSLFYGGVHGSNEKRVRAHLDRVIRDWEGDKIRRPRRTRHRRSARKYSARASR